MPVLVADRTLVGNGPALLLFGQIGPGRSVRYEHRGLARLVPYR
jgi:hypothetical protein